MDKNYEPQNIETKWYQFWESEGCFGHRGKGPSYCIMLPPPNVTGSLHMGHGFQQTLMDALTRYHRMSGDNTLWQPGTDHAGISTQIVVERQLEAQSLSRHDLGREGFVKRVWEWKETSGNRITQQMRRLGASVDWERERFTMDEGLSAAVQKVFIRLFDEGLIYRGTRLVNWDPVLQSAISDLEVISEEEPGTLWHLRYPLVGRKGYIVVATTRPETMLGDVAVAVHPDDESYKDLIGHEVELPFTGRRIPVIADDAVEPTFGSGCVKITPAHDFNDYAMAKRHDLPMINIFTKTAHINENAPEDYRGMERYAAREKILADLTKKDCLEKTEPHTLKVPRGEKSNVIVEPYLTEQWFVQIAPLAGPAIKAVEDGEIKFIPENWTKTYFQWMHNIEDWCISRQLWWGHRIPAWYDDKGNLYVGENESQVRDKHQLNQDIRLRQDQDVLDTWFSAALWPFSTLGWPDKTPELKAFYPTSVLVTGFDIIFFWVARMIMMGLKFTNKVPFHEVYITGLIRDADGHKMSKSKGNVLDPLDIIDGIELEDLVEKRTSHLLLESQKSTIEKLTRKEYPEGIAAFGTDALRFTYCALATQGRNIRFDLHRVDGYRNFCNKLWNATRYVVMNTEADQDFGDGPLSYSPADSWIQSRLQHTITEAHKHFQQYRFDLLANELYEFVWHEYCDWYLELSKPVLYGTDVKAALKRGAQATLVSVLETILRLLHPIMPFITEEIWQKISKLAGVEGDTIMTQPYPRTMPENINPTIEHELNWVKSVIVGIRTIRSEMNVAPSKRIPLLFNKGSTVDHAYIEKYRDLLMNLAKCDSINVLSGNDTQPLCATSLVGDLEILIPLADLIDKGAESERLTREIGKLEKELLKTTSKLENPAFTEKAPQDVVEKEQGRAAEMTAAIGKLQGQLEALSRL